MQGKAEHVRDAIVDHLNYTGRFQLADQILQVSARERGAKSARRKREKESEKKEREESESESEEREREKRKKRDKE